MVYNNNNKKLKKYVIVDFPSNKIFESSGQKKCASNVFLYLIKFMDIDIKNEDFFLDKFLVFTIKNIESNNEYKFIGNMIKLEKPVNINGIQRDWKVIIGKYNVDLDRV
jgi:hypothetical protein